MDNIQKAQRMISDAIAADSAKVVWVNGAWLGYKPSLTQGGRDVYSIDGRRVSAKAFWTYAQA